MKNLKKSINILDNDGKLWAFSGDNRQILGFVQSYEGDDLASDLIVEDFVSDAVPTEIVLKPA